VPRLAAGILRPPVASENPSTDPRRFPFRACGEDVTIYPGAKIVSPEVVSIGDSVIIDDFVFLMGGLETRIGSFVHLASFSSYLGGGTLDVDAFAGVSSGARIYTGTDDFHGGSLTGPTIPEEFREPVRSFVRIGKYAVIGANSVLLPGVTIGEGCTVGALSLVNRDCEPWTIYAGVPARAIKARRRDRIAEIEARLKSELYDSHGKYIPRSRR
jgi:acetyltransferase-like isoleucine patch superfamily enzyme